MLTKNLDEKQKPTMQQSTEASPSSTEGLFFQAFAAGSISSSCCLFQLLLNLLSSWNILHIGCAGFNTVLGPLRPYTRTMTLIWLLMQWFQHLNIYPPLGKQEKDQINCCCTTSRRKLFLSSLLCLGLMFMPELLESIRHSSFIQRNSQTISIDPRNVVELNYVVDNMGCEACINAVEKLMNGHIGVLSSKVSSFETGEVNIQVNKELYERNTEVTWTKYFEDELGDLLHTHGYELRPVGWITKSMKLKEKKKQDLFGSF
ncbi:hypothetical protein CTEN210_12309 [Chaetoceros tenuissimus]|uniref:HMA domain-containing protein n=1 Tax=Chaetoceros tenuissimus TaxID=426638 RepID=A0AAD3HAD4_9STRA|nr:hypothetical protein CTEN210_12309 [Chaetoceros tenuissimus]